MNSLIIAVLTVFLTLVVSAWRPSPSRMCRFFGSNFLLNYFLIGLMFPAATAILPLFIRIRDLGLLDTYWGVVLPQVAFGLGMSILLFRNYFTKPAGRVVPGGLRRWLRLYPILLVHLPAALAADHRDGQHHLLRRQLEQLHPAADHAEFGIEISMAARHQFTKR